MALLKDVKCNMIQVNCNSILPQGTIMKVDNGKVAIGKIKDVEKTIKQSKDKIDCLIKILVMKNIIKEDDVKDILDAMELMEKLSEN